MDYNIIRCNYDEHGKQILEIFNEAIENSTALYDYKKRSFETMALWFENKINNHYPVIGLEDKNYRLMGFASYGSFRNWPAYKYSVEHSIYIHKNFRGLGFGNILLKEIINEAKGNDIHVMVGGVDTENRASIALHEKHGFVHVGTLPQIGYKFGQWLDLAFYQLILNTPNNPMDG